MSGVGLLAALAIAQHCGYGGGYAQSYSYSYTPSYYYPTYSYPTYSYHQPYVQKVITKFVAVETPHYAALAGDYSRAEVKAKEQAAVQTQITQLTGAVDQLRQIVVATGQQQPAQQVQVQQTPQVQQIPAPQVQAVPQQPIYSQPQAPAKVPEQPIYSQPQTPIKTPEQPIYSQPQIPAKAPGTGYQPITPGKGYGAPTPPPIDPAGGQASNAGLNVLGRCAECHTAGSAKGGMTIFASPGQLAALSSYDWQDIDAAITEGRMPPPGSRGGPLSIAAVVAAHDFIRTQVGQAVANR